MNFKPKQFLKRIAATITAAALSLSLASQPALADGGFTGNSTGNSTYTFNPDGVTYGISLTGQYVSWRVSLYISTNKDGRINVNTDSIVGQKNLVYVGSIYYNNFPTNRTVYAQTDYTADRRDNLVTTTYPRVTRLRSTAKQLYGSDQFTPNKEPVYQVNNNSLLPSKVSECDGTKVKDIVEAGGNNAGSFTETVITHLNEKLGGTKKDLEPIYTQILSSIVAAKDSLGADVVTKLANSKFAAGKTDYSLLLPTNKKAIVEWVCVVEPTCEICTHDNSAFYDVQLYNSSTNSHKYNLVGLADVSAILAVDAYGFIQYNEHSKTDYAAASTLARIQTRIPDFQPYHAWPKATNFYTAWGKLRAELSHNSPNFATVNVDTHSGYTKYLGVYTTQMGATTFDTDRSAEFAKKGGISIYQTKIAEPTGIPVYYYIYDDNNKFVECKEESYDPAGNKNAKFVPSKDYGTPIADESNNTSDVKETINSKVRYADYWNYVGPKSYRKEYMREAYTGYSNLKYMTDGKGDAQNDEALITDAKPLTEGLAVYSNKKRDFVKSIHVKVIKAPSVDIYYHTYTYTIPDEYWDYVNSELAGLEGTAYEKRLEEIAEEKGFPLVYTVTEDKRTIALGK